MVGPGDFYFDLNGEPHNKRWKYDASLLKKASQSITEHGLSENPAGLPNISHSRQFLRIREQFLRFLELAIRFNPSERITVEDAASLEFFSWI
tara:strand:- start:279 stop:557 length:279 start_codon:yes stop_codon:yes gene_type:complete